MDGWSDALRITLVGLAVVFGVMGIIAGFTWVSGQVFVVLERRAKERKEAEEARRKEDKERRKAEKAKKKAAVEAEAAAPDAAEGGGAEG